MRTVNAATAALINSGRYLTADCFTFTLMGGAVYRCTSVGGLANIAGRTFASNGIQVRGLRCSMKLGAEVSEQQIEIIARPTDLLNGQPWLAALAAGALDGATIMREQAIMNPGAWNTVAVGSLVLFSGTTADVTDLGDVSATVKVWSKLRALDRDFPRNLWQPTCNWTLYEANTCMASRAANTISGSATGNGTTSNIIMSSAPADLTPYVQGALTFTGGANAGLRRTVKAILNGSPNSVIGLTRPFPSPAATGDSFTLSQGCDHTDGAQGCTKFGRLPSYGGFKDVPNVASGL